MWPINLGSTFSRRLPSACVDVWGGWATCSCARTCVSEVCAAASPDLKSDIHQSLHLSAVYAGCLREILSSNLLPDSRLHMRD